MAEFRDKRRCAPWWMCALVLTIAAFFGFVIHETFGKPVKPDVWNRGLIPPYTVWVYLVLTCLFNRESTLATRNGIVVSRGPIPLGPKDVIPRERIAFCYYYSIMATSDGGSNESFAIGHVPGVVTVEGRQVVLLEPFDDIDSARDAAHAIAAALNEGNVSRPVEVRALDEPREDPVGIRRRWVWAGIWAGAVAAGIAWEVAHHWHT